MQTSSNELDDLFDDAVEAQHRVVSDSMGPVLKIECDTDAVEHSYGEVATLCTKSNYAAALRTTGASVEYIQDRDSFLVESCSIDDLLATTNKIIAAEKMGITQPREEAKPKHKRRVDYSQLGNVVGQQKIEAPSTEERNIPAVVKEANGMIVSTEDGEVLNPEMLSLLLGMTEQQAQSFAITDEGSAEWYVGRVTMLQGEINKFATMAATMIRSAYTKLKSLDNRFGHQLDKYCQIQLEKEKTRNGTYKRKYLRFISGGVYYRKTGGYKMTSKQLLQEFIDQLPESEWNKYGVELVRKYDWRKVKAIADTGAYVPGYDLISGDELGKMSIGVEKAWSLNQAQELLKQVAMLTETENPEEL
jgi:hypothetical protein